MIEAKPVGPRVLVKPLEATDTIRNGVVLPPEVGRSEGISRGIVQSVGQFYRELTEEGPVFSPLAISPGEVVIYPDGAGREVLLDLMEDGTFEKFVVLDMREVLLALQEVRGHPLDRVGDPS